MTEETLTSTPKLVNLNDLVKRDATDVVLDLAGTPLPVRLKKSPGAGPEILHLDYLMARKELSDAARDARSLALADGEPGEARIEDLRLRSHAADAKVKMGEDTRRVLITHVVSWLLSWDAAAPDGSALPLDVDALYAADLPTELWDGVLAAILLKRAELDGTLVQAAPAPEKPKPRTRRRRPAEAVS